MNVCRVQKSVAEEYRESCNIVITKYSCVRGNFQQLFYANLSKAVCERVTWATLFKVHYTLFLEWEGVV